MMSQFTKVSLLAAVILPLSMAALGGVTTATVMPVAAPQYFNGTYAGAGLGSYNLNSPNTVTVDPITLPFGDPLAFKSQWDAGGHEALAQLFVGYGKVFNAPYYFGGELFGQYSPMIVQPNSFHAIDSSEQYELYAFSKIIPEYFFGATVRGGYLTSQKTMLYLLAGAKSTKFKIESELNSNLTDNDTIVKHKKQANEFGWIAGLGLETYLTDKLTLRTQYSYVNYCNVRFKNDATHLFNIDSTFKTQFNPYESIFTIDLSYYFG